MGSWGATFFKSNSLLSVVQPLPANVKQAMLGAARTKVIKRGSWTGCAFNAAGQEVGEKVFSTSTAAQVFGCEPRLVSNFISKWDSLKGTDEKCTQLLIDAIEQAGIFDTPEQSLSRQTRIVTLLVYESELTETRRKFDEMMANEEIQFVEEAEQLLCSV